MNVWNDFAKPIVVLGVICAVSSALLAATHSVTQPIIDATWVGLPSIHAPSFDLGAIILIAPVAIVIIIEHIVGIVHTERRVVVLGGGDDLHAAIPQAAVNGVKLCIGYIDIFQHDLDVILGHARGGRRARDETVDDLGQVVGELDVLVRLLGSHMCPFDV